MDAVTRTGDLYPEDTGTKTVSSDTESLFMVSKTPISGSCHCVTANSLLKKYREKKREKTFFYIGSSGLSSDTVTLTESATEALETPVSLSPASGDSNFIPVTAGNVNLEKIAVCHIIQGVHSSLTPQGKGGTPLLKNGKPLEIHFPCQSESDIPEEMKFVRWW